MRKLLFALSKTPYIEDDLKDYNHHGKRSSWTKKIMSLANRRLRRMKIEISNETI